MMKAGFVPQLRACGAKTKSYVVLVFTAQSSEGLTGIHSSTFTRRYPEPEPALLCLPSIWRGRRRRVCSAALKGAYLFLCAWSSAEVF
jgi:hypothetical protein